MTPNEYMLYVDRTKNMQNKQNKAKAIRLCIRSLVHSQSDLCKENTDTIQKASLQSIIKDDQTAIKARPRDKTAQETQLAALNRLMDQKTGV